MDKRHAGLRLRTRSRLLRCAGPACAALLLAACATGDRTLNQVPRAPAYVPPQQGERATVIIRVDEPHGHYVVSTFEQPVSCSKRHEITSGTETTPGQFQTALVAGRLQALSFSYRESRTTCEVTIAFEPLRGHTYLVSARVEGQRCALGIADPYGRPGTRVPILRREPVGFARASDACRPVASTALPGAAERPASIDDFRQLLENQ